MKWSFSCQASPTKSPYTFSLLAGLLAGLAFPPISQPWLLWMAFPLWWKVAQTRALYAGLFVWNFIGCYWLMLTALSAPDLQEAILSLGAGATAILVNPLLMLIPFFLWRVLHRGLGLPLSPWSFIPFWGTFEYLHFQWELSWDWLALGLAWSEWSPLRTVAAWVGPLGVSLWTLIGAAWIAEYHWGKALIWIIGVPFLTSIIPQSSSTKPPRSVWIIQPNIDPYVKFSDFPPDSQLKYLLSFLPAAPAKGSLIIFPETAIPVGVSIDYWREDPFLQPFFAYAQQHQVNILLGIVGYKYLERDKKPPVSANPLPDGRYYESYNAALLLRPDTAFLHIKDRLVPFVERTPYLETLPFLKEWMIELGGGFGQFGKPERQTTLPLYPDETPMAVAVCYESIFVHDVRKRLLPAPTFLAVITNDGWWKKSSGYYQHLSYGRMTAATLGVPVLRAANTGVSAFLSASGEIASSLEYAQAGTLYQKVAPQTPTTGYVRWGEWGWGGLVIFASIVWIIRLWLFRRSSA
ncbi:MAG: apolipoprotein N-acyltransferase [Bacteroidia bacterium]|nr:apolipoprotein N-acyltransferase [Bacteroidia bacterium]MDW8235527.1 apolipoprotein N-acyltransferase [Bacteroidia bacterium]